MIPLRPTFWTVRDNTVGTAHYSRLGRTVDFRPHGGAVVHGYNLKTWRITVQPARGVDCAEMAILSPCTVEREDVVGVHETSVTVRLTLAVCWNWCPVTAKVNVNEPMYLPLARADESASEQQMAQADKMWRQLVLLLADPTEVLKRAQPTRRELGRLLMSPRRESTRITLLRRAAESGGASACTHNTWSLIRQHGCTTDELVAVHMREREARKVAWFLAHGADE